jgi:hypothetical protein
LVYRERGWVVDVFDRLDSIGDLLGLFRGSNSSKNLSVNSSLPKIASKWMRLYLPTNLIIQFLCYKQTNFAPELNRLPPCIVVPGKVGGLVFLCAKNLMLSFVKLNLLVSRDG